MTEEMTYIKETMKKFSSDTELRIGSVEHISKVGVLKDITRILSILGKFLLIQILCISMRNTLQQRSLENVLLTVSSALVFADQFWACSFQDLEQFIWDRK